MITIGVPLACFDAFGPHSEAMTPPTSSSCGAPAGGYHNHRVAVLYSIKIRIYIIYTVLIHMACMANTAYAGLSFMVVAILFNSTQGYMGYHEIVKNLAFHQI